MSRVWALIALTVALALGLPRGGSTAGQPATPVPSSATPAPLVLGETPGAVPVALHIENRGDRDDWLVGGSTPIAQRVEVHRSRLDHGVRVMAVAPDGVRIPAGSTVFLEPGSAHVMLIGLDVGLIQGRTFPLTLHFARAGDVEVTARVRRKVDAAGVPPLPAVTGGEITVSLVSAPPAPATVP
jgi:copper(I)-binding protein